MRRVLVFLLATAVLVAFAWWLADLPGTVGASVGSVAISLPTSWAALGLLVLLAVVYVLVRLLVMIVRLPARTRRLRAERARKPGADAVTRTLLALAGGDPDTARAAGQAEPGLAGRHAADPAAGRLCRPPGRPAERRTRHSTCWRPARTPRSSACAACMQGAVARGDWDAATALARQAEEVNPDAPWLRAERERLAIRAGSWKEALDWPARAPGRRPRHRRGRAEADAGQARRLAQQAWRPTRLSRPPPSPMPAACARPGARNARRTCCARAGARTPIRRSAQPPSRAVASCPARGGPSG